MIYHITSREARDEARKREHYSAPSLESEGFIHCSRREQVLAVANDFYRGQSNLLLLCIDEGQLSCELRWEAPADPAPAAAKPIAEEAPFPRIYGHLNLDAVGAALDFPEAEAGFRLPPALL